MALTRTIRTAVLVCALTVPCAEAAETGARDRLQSVFDGVARGINYLGQQAGRLIGGGLGLGEETQAEYTETRPFSERYPVDAAPVVSISNEFGEIRVSTWEDRVVEVTAEIIVGADTAEAAGEVAASIGVSVNHRPELVEVRTVLPEAGRSAPHRSITVNYRVTVPASASVTTDNYFGDTWVSGARGLVAVESQYGQVDLSGLSGAVKVRAHGEFPLRAAQLAEGGDFDLHGAAAEFRQVGGTLRVSAFRGSVLVAEVPAEARVVVDVDSGPVTLVLPPDSAPDLTATVLHGNLDSALPLTRTAQGNKVVARAPSPDSQRQAVLTAAFGDVTVRMEGQKPRQPDVAREQGRSVSDVVNWSGTPAEGAAVFVEAIVGDVRVTPSPDGQLRVEATRIVRVPAPNLAAAALSALELRVQPEPSRVSVVTVVTEAMADLRCESFRVDLSVQCPPGLPLEVRAADGRTTVTGMSGGVTVNQAVGDVQAGQLAGPVTLAAQNGGVDLDGSAGATDISASYGGARLVNVAGALTARTTEGRLVIDAPGSSVYARSSGGDIRVLALDGVGGDFDILAEQGDVSLMPSPEADVTLRVQTGADGEVHSKIPLNGSISAEAREFHGRLKEGKHRIVLEARGGDIYLD